MNERPAPLVRSLSIHAEYRCRDSGACCSSGWPIPIEIPQYEQLVASLKDGSIAVVDADGATAAAAACRSHERAPFAPHRGLPEGAAAVLAHGEEDGRCVFYEADAKRCRIQRVKGHAALPMACQQFPRMCLLDPRGIQITLSHYCPTAADLLFADESRPLAIVAHPPAFPPDFPYEGLDARDAFPPLLRPGVLLDWNTLDAFETHAIRALDAETRSVDAALARIHTWAEQLRTWRDHDGPLLATFERIVRVPNGVQNETRSIHETPPIDFETVFQLDAEIRAAVPPGSVIQGAPRDALDAYQRWVAPAWSDFTRPLCRYLGAKLFANWCWYQGNGQRSLMRSLHAALAVLRVEAARQTLANGRMLEARLLREAFRQTDLLLIHLADQDALARGWAAAE